MKVTNVLYQNVNHPLFRSIDINRAAGLFVVVDPFDRSHLLYLSERAYNDLLKVILSNDGTLVVVARPEDNLVEIMSDLIANDKSSKHNPDSGNTASGDDNSSEDDLSSTTPLAEDIRSSKAPHPLANAMTKEEFDSLSEQQKCDVEHQFRVNRNSRNFSKIWEDAKNSFARFRFKGLIDRESKLLGLSVGNIRTLYYHWGVISSIRLGWTSSSLSLRLTLVTMVSHLIRLYRHNGLRTMILCLKVSLHAIYSYIAGSPLTDTRFLGLAVGLSNGLPTWIPVNYRARVRAGDVRFIRWLATFMVSYKAIRGAYQRPTLDTIRNTPFIGDLGHARGFLPRFWTYIGREFRFPEPNIVKSPFSVKTGPNFYLAPLGAVLDLLAWQFLENRRLWEFMFTAGQTYLATVYVETLNRVAFTGVANVLRSYRMMDEETGRVGQFPRSEGDLRLGKLALKYEAAGKVRVFAIVDFWTHMALYPLHLWIFSILRRLPQDGTFDQRKSIRSFVESYGSTPLFSFDLSAATDNIPVALTTTILSFSLGPKFAKCWENLLVDRIFKVPKGPRGADPSEPNYIRYGRGQPMGALSSWASLALTHHFIVQLAAMRVDLFPFEGYRVLGDDIIISGEEVANSYKQVCLEFEIPINNKGITSDPARSVSKGKSLANFANQYYLGTENISPISLKEEIAISTLAQRVESVARLAFQTGAKYTRSYLADLIKATATKASAVSKMLTTLTSGGVPSHIRPLLAIILLPTGQPGFTTPEDPQVQGYPFYNAFRALNASDGLLLGCITSPDPVMIKHLDQTLVFGSSAYEYWFKQYTALGQRWEDMVNSRYRMLGSPPFMDEEFASIYLDSHKYTWNQPFVLASASTGSSLHQLPPELQSYPGRNLSWRSLMRAWLSVPVLRWVLLGSSPFSWDDRSSEVGSWFEIYSPTALWYDTRIPLWEMDTRPGDWPYRFGFTGRGYDPSTVVCPSLKALGEGYVKISEGLDTMESEMRGLERAEHIRSPWGFYLYAWDLHILNRTERLAARSDLVPDPFHRMMVD